MITDQAGEHSGDDLLHNLLAFARLLRSLRVSVSPEQIADLVCISEKVGIAHRADFYYAARSLLVRRRDDLDVFDRAFDLFFHIQGQPQQSVVDPTQAPAHRIFRRKPAQPAIERELKKGRKQNEKQDDEAGGADKAMTYSPMEVLRRKDFDQFSVDETRAARRLIAEMDWQIGERKTRRKRSNPRGNEIDRTRVLRKNVKYGTDILNLPRRVHKTKPRPLVVLADISGSMERYSRMVLHLVHTLYHQSSLSQVGPVEAFVFSTRLTRITPKLKRKSVDQALESVSKTVVDWSGGTRIGDALKTFNFKWARRVLRSHAVVLIISDGWDRGDLNLLQAEIARLQKSCSRLVWLDPLLGKPSFQATAMGLQTVLPYVDDFLPAHNVTSLEMLVAHLAALGETKPLRRQHPQRSAPKATPSPEPQVTPPPQMGTSDYVRRTIVLHTTEGGVVFKYEENNAPDRPSEPGRKLNPTTGGQL
jgi:uncharacterized protein